MCNHNSLLIENECPHTRVIVLCVCVCVFVCVCLLSPAGCSSLPFICHPQAAHTHTHARARGRTHTHTHSHSLTLALLCCSAPPCQQPHLFLKLFISLSFQSVTAQFLLFLRVRLFISFQSSCLSDSLPSSWALCYLH